MAPHDRRSIARKLLFKLADAIDKEADALARLEVPSSGKPLAEAQYDVADAANCFEFYGGLATKIHGETMSVPANTRELRGARAGRRRAARSSPGTTRS